MTSLLAKLRPFIWFVVLLAAAWGLRAPFLQRAQWNLDEGVTFTIAQQIREGAVLYRDAADHRSPLVPYLKAAVFAVAGDWNVQAVHLLVALALGVVAFLLRDLCRRLGAPATGAWTAALFTLFAFIIPGSYDSLAAHTEWFVVFFSTVGFWLFARASGTGGFLAGLPVGLAFGASALCKQPGLLDFGVTWVLLALAAFADRSQRPRFFRLWLGAVLGVAVCFAAAFLYFWAHDALRDFVYYGWTYNTKIYVPEIPVLHRLVAARVPFLLAWQYVPLAAVVIVLAAGALLFRAARAPFAMLPWLILGWSASGLVSCVLSGREFDHYSIQSIPGFSLACGWLLARVARIARSATGPRWRRVAAIAALVVFVAWIAVDLVRFTRKLNPRDDPEHARIAAAFQRYSGPREPVAIWGYYPEGHLIAHRLPATRFVYSNFLTGMIPWTNLAGEIDTHYAVVPGAWAAFWRDFHARPPVFIVEAVMRGYRKYPLLGQAGLRDEIIDRYAEMEHVAAEAMNFKFYRRLAPLSSDFPNLTAAPSATVELHPARVPGSPDIAFVRVLAPGQGGAVTLRLGGRAYRRVELPGDAPVDASFLIRLADLAAPGAEMIDAVLQRDGRATASPALDVVRRLALEVSPAEPVPVLAYGIHRIESPTSNAPAAWHPEPRGESLGWSTVDAFALDFARPAALQILQFEWQPPVAAEGRFELLFTAAGASTPTPLAFTVVPTPQGPRQVTAELPADTAGRITLRWTPPAQMRTAAWLGHLAGFAPGPGLSFRERSIPPSAAEHVSGAPLTRQPDGSWLAPAPFRLLYPRLDRMNALVVDYGFLDRAYTDPAARPGEIGFEVNFVHEDGRRENLLSDLIRPRLNPETRGRHTNRVGLPPAARGEIEIKCGVVAGTESPDNQLYLFPPRIQGPGPDLVISAGRILTPTESETASGDPIRQCVNGRWIAHAPGHVVYNCPADLRTVDFGFGLDEGAYWGDNGAMRSNGIDVVVEFRDEKENATELYRRRIDPRLVIADRGIQHGHIQLPGRSGKLVFHMAPGPNNDASYDWSYWTDFAGQADATR